MYPLSVVNVLIFVIPGNSLPYLVHRSPNIKILDKQSGQTRTSELHSRRLFNGRNNPMSLGRRSLKVTTYRTKCRRLSMMLSFPPHSSTGPWMTTGMVAKVALDSCRHLLNLSLEVSKNFPH
jgi:hypothetical protein